jgi:hypothetical protein
MARRSSGFKRKSLIQIRNVSDQFELQLRVQSVNRCLPETGAVDTNIAPLLLAISGGGFPGTGSGSGGDGDLVLNLILVIDQLFFFRSHFARRFVKVGGGRRVFYLFVTTMLQ